MAVGQSSAALDRNKLFFAQNAEYARKIADLDTYQRIREVLNREIDGVNELLDVGNGGVFDYDTDLVRHIVAVDLFLDDVPESAFPANVTPKNGDALNLAEPSAAYDVVLANSLFHHLVGDSWQQLIVNVRRALSEACRVLRVGGRLVTVESCVPAWFFTIEKLLFKPAQLVSRLPALQDSHPVTLQLPVVRLLDLMSEHFVIDRLEPVKGRWILQFGKRWPLALTPATPYLVVARKESATSSSSR